MERSTELRREYIVFSRMKSDLQRLGEEMSTTDTVWDSISGRITRPIGWILFVAGALIWSTYAVYEFINSPGAVWEKLTTAAIVIGLAMLLLSAVIDRLIDLKTDPYREIER